MVKISNKTLLAGGLATAIGLTSCGKYEDGPAFSLLTKTQRLTGDWEMTKWVEDGDDMIGNGIEMEIEFDKDGDFDLKLEQTYTDYYGNSYTYSNNVGGDWEFSSDKEEIELDFDEGGSWEIEITRLTNKEFQGEITLGEYGKGNLFSKVSGKSGGEEDYVRFEAEKN
tara:strand:- start:111 stop:614 length:504 start_codon:yes stop_codon:yes gene_type:complete